VLSSNKQLLLCLLVRFLPGSYYCGFCKEGYMGSSQFECYSNNFCTSDHPVHRHTCSEYADCIFTGPGAYKCEVSAVLQRYIIQVWSQSVVLQ